MKIFLTGYNGFLGKNVRKFYSSEFIIFYQREQDITDALMRSNPDLIINCACEIYDSTKMWEVNVDLVTKIIDYCERYGKRLIHFGSSSEYGDSSIPTSETHPLNGKDAYASSKKEATMRCLNSNAEIAVIRPYSPYGWGEKSHRLFPRFVRSFLYNEPMHLKQGVHDFCYIDDFMQGVHLVIKNNITGPINISSGIQSTNMQVLDAFRKCTGTAGNVTLIDEMSTPAVWQCDNTLIKSLGWKPLNDLEQGVGKLLRLSYE